MDFKIWWITEISKVIGTEKIDLEFMREGLRGGQEKKFKWETVNFTTDVGPKELL